MTIWENISFTKIVSLKNSPNDWIIYRDLTKFHYCMYIKFLSDLRRFNVRRGFLEIPFLPKFQIFLQQCDDNCIKPET